MLIFVLDALHEDLNRIKEKPYLNMEEKNTGESDQEASERWKKNHHSRENSIITDLFHGQYKSIISCPECDKISITYDSFMYLSLPIPSEQIMVTYKYFNNNSKYDYKIYSIDLVINPNSVIKDLKTKIVALFIENETISIDFLSIVLVSNSTKTFKRVLNDDEKILQYDNSTDEQFLNGGSDSLAQQLRRADVIRQNPFQFDTGVT